MRAHYFQHVPFEGLGTIHHWLKSHEYQITRTRFFESQELPDPREIDFLIIMGGPMSVNDEAKFPWLSLEKNFVRELIRAGKPVLGICLGAQLIANAIGAKVFPNAVKEIGWFPIQSCEGVGEKAFQFPQTKRVFHWHGETFDMPTGAIRLARSLACENQAFQIGRRVIGLQFHLETTPESAREMVSHCGDELIPGRFVQSGEEILSAGREIYQSINDLMNDILTYMTTPAS